MHVQSPADFDRGLYYLSSTLKLALPANCHPNCCLFGNVMYSSAISSILLYAYASMTAACCMPWDEGVQLVDVFLCHGVLIAFTAGSCVLPS